MTDNRTTELLCELLEERGIEWKDGDAAYEIEWSTPDGRHCSAMYWKPTFTVLISGCTPEQAIAATLGSEVANADDALSLLDEIREAGRISYDDYSQLFDAIAELGSGTCNPIETETLENVTAHVMECDRCGKVYEHVNGAYEHCPRCGRRVER